MLTVEHTVIGTLPYIAPEQLPGGECDTRANIFSFWAVMNEMLTSRQAFKA
jgi:serine/threonine protein kinase